MPTTPSGMLNEESGLDINSQGNKNQNLTRLDSELHGAKAYTLTTADVTVTGEDDFDGTYVLSGALTGDHNFIVPAIVGDFKVTNNCTSHKITVKTPSGTGVNVPTGKTVQLACDGTNVIPVYDAKSVLFGAWASASSTPVAVNGKIAFTDADGTVLGYVPTYAALS